MTELKSGAFGTVYAVSPTSVCKILPPTESDKAKRELEMHRYSHPNIIGCLGVGVFVQTGVLFERAEEDMFDYLEAIGAPLNDEQLDAFAFDLISAVSYLHAQTPPIYHLDIKLENLLHTRAAGYGDVLKVADFGFAHCNAWVDGAHSFGSQAIGPVFCGSLAYMPHGSLAADAAFLPHRDAWAVGCVLFMMAYGTMLYEHPATRPYKSVWSKIETNVPATFAELYAYAPRFIEPVLTSLLRPRPAALRSVQTMFMSSMYTVPLDVR